MSGLDRLFALKGRLDVPKSHITKVKVMERKAVPSTPGTLLRAPGTRIPGLIRHGSYGREPDREFWAVYRHREVVVIEIADWAYSRLVLGMRDPHVAAALLETDR
jgi:hypothetical protein